MAAYIETPDPPAWYDTARAAAYQRGYLDAVRACEGSELPVPSSVGEPCIGRCDACGDEDGPWVPTIAGWLCRGCDQRTAAVQWNDDPDPAL